MLFITPPKLSDFCSPSPSPSPLLDVMNSLNSLLEDDSERKKLLDNELLKLLEGTPVQKVQPVEPKKFTVKK